MRTFLALELPQAVKKEIAVIIEKFLNSVPNGIKWVREENLHVTFQFIGDTQKEDIPEIIDFLSNAFSQLSPIDFFEPKLEIIPGRNPRIIWISLQTNHKDIFKVSRKFKNKLMEMSYQPDSKPLKFHVTLGRVKKRLPEFFIQQILTTELNIEEIEISEAALYQSFLRPEGPVYEKISDFKLGI